MKATNPPKPLVVTQGWSSGQFIDPGAEPNVDPFRFPRKKLTTRG